MIDLHCHMLPGIDDGAKDLRTSLEMARMAVADGIRITACTPHIYPGLYDNQLAGIRRAVDALRQEFSKEGIKLALVTGADVHLDPNLPEGLRTGRVATLNNTRYLLFEPPHHVAPPRFEDSVFELVADGYVPVITHPERLTWIETHYSIFERLVSRGVWMQLTSGSLTGRFGRRPKYWSEKMLDQGYVHILATDAHSVDKRPPLLREGMLAAERWVGAEEARRMVVDRPRAILDNVDPDQVPAIPALASGIMRETPKRRSFLSLFGGGGR